ncbi:hypothetical protein GIS00_01730 [Nakamurella sp. YIM 132087]|uniref:F420-dependent oxidoreductase n=1 Tax=Nakamurella alba TaxID=2665158 RepID=A0A7K1FEX4_9ACTN|nr:Pr6Pr family membrane protein [Nakamurella alba]MTD12665.1 hypothetical protein [Nakamurella alba]
MTAPGTTRTHVPAWHRLLGLLRIAFALATLAAVIGQIVISTGRPGFRVDNFFSFFTIESNVLNMVVMGAAGVLALSGRSATRLAAWRGAATLYMTITGIVYVTLLSGLEASLQTATPWVNTILHYLMPVVALVDFLVDRTVRPLGFVRPGLFWLIFPLLYLIYSEIRGPIIDWYPYPFLNPDNGIGGVVVASLGIAVLAVVLTWLLCFSTRARTPRP